LTMHPVALWIMMAWAHPGAAIYSPILMVTSAEANSGKTTLLGLVGSLVPRSLLSVGVSEAALYRSIELWNPTIIANEFDYAAGGQRAASRRRQFGMDPRFRRPALRRRRQDPAPVPDVLSEGDRPQGTAFYVSKDGKALTNAHVVEGCRQISVNTGGQTAAAKVLARDGRNDLALITTELHPADLINWRLSVRQGEDIVVYGFPLTGMLASGGNVATGNVTALAGLGNDSRFLFPRQDRGRPAKRHGLNVGMGRRTLPSQR
jgi:S1-C subfamily serine protease